MGGTRVGDVLAVIGFAAGLMIAFGYWQIGLGLFALTLGYAGLRVRYLELP
jgi:hypothetical protein